MHGRAEAAKARAQLAVGGHPAAHGEPIDPGPIERLLDTCEEIVEDGDLV